MGITTHLARKIWKIGIMTRCICIAQTIEHRLNPLKSYRLEYTRRWIVIEFLLKKHTGIRAKTYYEESILLHREKNFFKLHFKYFLDCLTNRSDPLLPALLSVHHRRCALVGKLIRKFHSQGINLHTIQLSLGAYQQTLCPDLKDCWLVKCKRIAHQVIRPDEKSPPLQTESPE